MKTTVAHEKTERLALTYLGRDCDFVTNAASLRKFVAAVFSHFITSKPVPGPARRFSAIEGNDGRFELDIDGQRFTLDGASSVEAVVYQQLADWLLAGCDGFVPLHAAALTTPGIGLLLAGGRGSGKSTLTTALMGLGFKVLSDDAAVVEMRGRRLHPFPRAIGLMEKDDRANVMAKGGGATALRGRPVARLKMMPGGEEKKFFKPDRAATAISTTKVTHLFFLGDTRPSGELAVILANRPAPETMSAAKIPVVESTKDGLAYVRITPEGDLGEQLAACRHAGFLPLGIEPVRRERPRFESHPKAVRLAADEALIRLWQALKPAALMDKSGGKLFYELGGLLRGLPVWTIRPGPPEATARLIAEIAGGAR